MTNAGYFSTYPTMLSAIFAVVGLGLVIWPRSVAGWAGQRHAKRLSELRSGEKEQFFEEFRSLATYATPTASMLRLIGAAMVLAAIVLAILGGS